VLLARGTHWQLSFRKGDVEIVLLREAQTEELPELTIEVPLESWNRVVKQVRADRKLLGGILLDFAKHKEHVATAIAKDRLLSELQRSVLDATTSLVEQGTLALTPIDVGAD